MQLPSSMREGDISRRVDKLYMSLTHATWYPGTYTGTNGDVIDIISTAAANSLLADLCVSCCACRSSFSSSFRHF